jgi:hypothetical protein
MMNHCLWWLGNGESGDVFLMVNAGAEGRGTPTPYQYFSRLHNPLKPNSFSDDLIAFETDIADIH